MWREDVRPEPVMMGRLATISQAGALLDKSDVFSQVLLSEKSEPFFRVSSRKFFGFRRGHAASFRFSARARR